MCAKYSCIDCEYQSARMGCMDRIKEGCVGCHLKGEYAYQCKCTSHELTGEDCPDFQLMEGHPDAGEVH